MLGPLAGAAAGGVDPRQRGAVRPARATRGACALPDDADLDAAIRTLTTSAASIRLYNLELTSEFRDVASRVRPVVRDLVGDDEGGVDA